MRGARRVPEPALGIGHAAPAVRKVRCGIQTHHATTPSGLFQADGLALVCETLPDQVDGRPARAPRHGRRTELEGPWPLVEWRRPISEMSDAQGMARLFDSASHLEHVVLFIDEVEEFAASRSDLGGAAHIGTNELLKALTRFRSGGGRLLIASTNHVSRLDPAILRPGRFDLVVPVGAPGAPVRRLMIEQRLSTICHAVSSLDKSSWAQKAHDSRSSPPGRYGLPAGVP